MRMPPTAQFACHTTLRPLEGPMPIARPPGRALRTAVPGPNVCLSTRHARRLRQLCDRDPVQARHRYRIRRQHRPTFDSA